MYNTSVDAVVITVDLNESVSATVAHGFTLETTVSNVEIEGDAYTTFNVLRFFIGAAGVVTNLFVLVVMFGFMELRTKV
jgi:hypothetical protein